MVSILFPIFNSSNYFARILGTASRTPIRIDKFTVMPGNLFNWLIKSRYFSFSFNFIQRFLHLLLFIHLCDGLLFSSYIPTSFPSQLSCVEWHFLASSASSSSASRILNCRNSEVELFLHFFTYYFPDYAFSFKQRYPKRHLISIILCMFMFTPYACWLLQIKDNEISNLFQYSLKPLLRIIN